jgi:CobQ-like glutamine amidotransferase family enzyme
VANGDDPLVVYAASAAGRVTWVGTGLGWRSDAAGCPVCGGLVEVGEDGWGCRCGFERPALGWWVDGEELVCADGRRFRLDLAIPGGFNRANAAMAAVAASELGVELPGALERMAVVDQVEGRFQRVDVGGTSLELMLAKNPAGWAELLDLVVGDDRPIAIGINAEVADGRDPSWLWDVAFERLEGRRVIATGARCLDLGVRLLYAGVEHAVIPDQVAALSRLEARDAVFIGNYTAFQQLRRSLASRHAGPRLMPGSLRRGFSRTRSPLPGEPPEMHPHRPSWTGCPASQPIEVPATASRESTGSARPAIHGRAGGESRLRVVVVYPELLGTYGDTGNGIVLAARALWREMGAELVMARFDDPLPLSGDVYCIGGGEDGPQAEAAGHLGALAGPLERGAVVLAVCAGLQIIGTDFSDPTGRRLAGAGLVDASTDRPMTRRAVGEILSEGIPAGLGLLSGFENHAGATELGTGVSPLARVLRGTGNSERARVDGVLTRSIVGTYMHGPVLARNPRLADHLIEVATGITLPPLGPGEEGEIESLRAERVRSLQRLRRRMAFSAW